MRYLLFLLSFAIMLGCANKNTPDATETKLINGMPAWYWNPSAEKLGGVGEAGFNLKGRSFQRQLAISRAVDEIARQKGVHVQTVQEITQEITDNTESTAIGTYSVHTVEGTTIYVRLREIWVDRDVMYAWVTEQ